MLKLIIERVKMLKIENENDKEWYENSPSFL